MGEELTNKIETIDDSFQTDILTCIDNATVIRSSEHFKICNCRKDDYLIILDDLTKKELEELKNDDTIGESIKIMRLQRLEDVARKQLFKCLDKPICPIEKNELVNTINVFSSKYDLSDPRVFSIVRSILDLQLTALRMQRESNFSGVILNVRNKYGDVIPTINPVEEVKRRYNESLIRGVEILNKLIEGEKTVNLNFDMKGIKVFNREEMYGEDIKK